MKRTDGKTTWISTAILLAAVSIFMVACSEEYTSPVASNNAENSAQADFRYPEITPEMLAAGPASGFEFLQISGDRMLDDPPPCDSLSDSGLAGPHHDRTLKIDHLVEVKVRHENMPSDANITIVAPMGCTTVLDCYPHPFQFNGPVEIKWKIKDLHLPDDFDFDSLVPFYVTDDGQYLPLDYEWQGNHDKLLIRTDHFSRYIIGRRASN